MKRLLIALLLVPLVGAGGVWYWHSNGKSAPKFRTARVERGDLVASINATGTIEPEEVVDVGAQIAGQIKRFGVDPRDEKRPIDYGSPVEEGTVLAWIDDALYKAQLNQAEANLAHAQADLRQLRAKEVQAKRDWDRAKPLKDQGAITDGEFELAETTCITAQAATAVGDAAVQQAKASRDQAQINLSYCTIKSPVKGVIVDRRVNIGQTVVASLNTPSLFLIAKDLRKLQVWASVNEADVGHIKSGQKATFTVDAFSGRTFNGAVVADQPRLNASMSQNVVTYTVVVGTENPQTPEGRLLLLPYMTANLRFIIGRQSNVLHVPSAALRFQPAPEYVAPEFREEYAASSGRRRGGDMAAAEEEKQSEGTLWVVEEGFLRPVSVEVGLSDGSRTEIRTDELSVGSDVVTGLPQVAADDDTKNPFAPRIFRGKKQ
jgi:HlyD family secretion protein